MGSRAVVADSVRHPLRAVWLTTSPPAATIDGLLLGMVQRTLPDVRLRQAFLEELSRTAKRLDVVLDHLELREVRSEPGSTPPLVIVSAKSAEHDPWLEMLLLPGGDCPVAILIETWDHGRIALVHEAVDALSPVHQQLVRRYAALAGDGLTEAAIIATLTLALAGEDDLHTQIFEARRQLAGTLDPSVLLSQDGSIRVQVGSVSETTRNLLREGLRGEHVFILPHLLFEGRTNYADIEFLVYLNFFAGQGQATRLVGTARQRLTLERLLTLVIFGIFDPAAGAPSSFESLQASYAVPDPATLAFLRAAHETYAVRAGADLGGAIRTLEEYVRFTELKENGVVIDVHQQAHADSSPVPLGQVGIARAGDGFQVRITQADGRSTAKRMDVTTRRRPLRQVPVQAVDHIRFGTRRPRFGITPLGTSHGFDPHGDVTTFVVWVNGRGIVVDPSPEGLGYLRRIGVAEADLPFVLLTHVHADHDGGLIEQILTGGRTTLIASDVVFRTFVEKARLLTGHDVEGEGLVGHISANPGTPTTIEIGGERADIATRWNLHPIPTNGFRIAVAGKVFGYAGDTQYEPLLIRRLHDEGRITTEQMRMLLYFFWTEDGTPTVDLLYHEAGIPPIHTHHRDLACLAEAVKERIFVVHVADRDVPPESRPAKPTLFETQVLVASDAAVQHDVLLSSLRLVSYLYDAPAMVLEKLLAHGVLREYEAGTHIMRKGPRAANTSLSFFVVIDGEVAVRDGRRLMATLQKGDTFGEWGISHQRGFRTADVVAVRPSQCLEFGEDQYRWLVLQSPVIRERIGTIRRLLPQLQTARAQARLKAQRDPSARPSVITAMNSSQLASFALFSTVKTFKDGEAIITEGSEADGFYVLLSGHLLVTAADRVLGEVPEGDIFGELGSLEGRTRTATVTVVSAEAEVLFMQTSNFRQLLHAVPAFALHVRETALSRLNAAR